MMAIGANCVLYFLASVGVAITSEQSEDPEQPHSANQAAATNDDW